MQHLIKNLHKLKNVITDEQINQLEHSAMMHQRYAWIFFKVIRVDIVNKILTIEVRQENTPYKNFADKKRLTEIVEETFGRFFEGWQIHKAPLPYTPSPAEVVTAEWIKQQMQRYKIGAKKMVEDLGVAKSDISAMINEHKAMGGRTRAMFYYYFKFIESQRSGVSGQGL